MTGKKPVEAEWIPGGLRLAWTKENTQEELDVAIASLFPEPSEPAVWTNVIAFGSSSVGTPNSIWLGAPAVPTFASLRRTHQEDQDDIAE